MKIPSLAAVLFAAEMATASGQSAQELINSVLNPDPSTSSFSSYSSQIYYNATLFNETPITSTNYEKLEASAKKLLDPAAYDYAAGGAGLETTVANNRAAFSRVCRSESSEAPYTMLINSSGALCLASCVRSIRNEISLPHCSARLYQLRL